MAAALGIVADVPGVASWCQRANRDLVIKGGGMQFDLAGGSLRDECRADF